MYCSSSHFVGGLVVGLKRKRKESLNYSQLSTRSSPRSSLPSMVDVRPLLSMRTPLISVGRINYKLRGCYHRTLSLSRSPLPWHSQVSPWIFKETNISLWYSCLSETFKYGNCRCTNPISFEEKKGRGEDHMKGYGLHSQCTAARVSL